MHFSLRFSMERMKELSLRFLEMWETTIFFAIAVIAVRPWLSLWQDLFRFRHLRETQFRFLVPWASCLSSKSGRQSGSTMPTCKTSGCGSCCSLHVVPVQFPSAHRWEQRETGKSCWQSERAELRWRNRLHTSSGSQGGGFADLCVLALSMILPLRTSFNLSSLILW